MNVLLTAIVKALGDSFAKVLVLALKTIKSFFDYKKTKIEDKKDKEEKEKQEEYEKQVDDVVDNGDIEDLLDLKKKG